jgi:cobalt-zinc-cadmium resistance protein CzcA
MLRALVEFSLSQRLIVLLGAAILIAAGLHAYRELPIDAFPDVSTTQVKIIIKAPGMTPEEVESRIAVPIELEMLGIPHQAMLRTVSKYALVDVTVDFQEGTDIYWARQQVAERLAGIRGELPASVTGGLAPITTPLGETYMFLVEGEGVSLAERRAVLDWTLRPALRTVPGVADVNALGGLVETYEVAPRQAALTALGLTLDDLKAALLANNRNDGAGRLTEGEETLLVRSEGRIRTLADVERIVVKAHPIQPVRVREVADVRMDALTRYGGVTRDGQGEAVEGLVLGLRGANARQLVAGIEAKLQGLAPSLPVGVSVRTFYNRGELVGRAVGTITHALTEAVVLVVLLLFPLFGNLRASLTVALILPLAALSAFILMHMVGMSANLMSLGGLAIAIGKLVDPAIVAVENIVSHLEHAKEERPIHRLHVVYRAMGEIITPLTGGMLINVVVFLPLLTLEGLEGKLFSPVAVTLIFALGASLLLAFTVIPVLASLLLVGLPHGEPRLVRFLVRHYRACLGWALRHEPIVYGAACLSFVVAMVLYAGLGKTFMPTMDEGDLIVQNMKLPSISLERSLALDVRVEKAILEKVPEVRGVVARAGSDEIGLDPMGLNETDMFLQLKPRDEWGDPDKRALIQRIRRVLDDFPGVEFVFTQPIEMRVSEMLTGVRGDVAIKVFGPDLTILNQKAAEIVAVVKRIRGAAEVFTPKNEGVQYLQLRFDRLAIGRIGLSVDDMEQRLRAVLEGERLGLVYAEGRRIPLVMRGDQRVRYSPAEFTDLILPLKGGERVPLNQIAEIERVEGPVKIGREQGARVAAVTANVGGRDLVGFVDEAKEAVAQGVSLPPGYSLQWGGQFENQQRAAKRLAIVVPVSVLLIFILLFLTFRSVKLAALIITNVPFAMVGGVVGLFLAHEYLSVPASVGFIALFGIAVLNGVVLVSHLNHLRDLGLPLDELVVSGACHRLRPVLMTAGTAAFGLVPLLYASGPGSELQRPLAVVGIGGLVTSTALTLILLPLLYRRLHRGGETDPTGPGP